LPKRGIGGLQGRCRQRPYGCVFAHFCHVFACFATFAPIFALLASIFATLGDNIEKISVPVKALLGNF
jgi:hypothetical protein